MGGLMKKLFLAILFAAGAFAQTRPVEVEKQRVLYLSREYLRHAQYLQGKDQDVIAAWGWRVLQFPIDSGKYTEVVPEDPKYRFSNGAVALDVNGDGNEELILSRFVREGRRDFQVVWYERVPGGGDWIPHEIGIAPGPGDDTHDMVKFVDPKSGVQGLIVSVEGAPFTCLRSRTIRVSPGSAMTLQNCLIRRSPACAWQTSMVTGDPTL